ncbi:type II secretion system protein E [candidate division TM7 genomosp. GTL1]|nr:type II secretion system protein E [candidate division TM7 genomosp. GTL1]
MRIADITIEQLLRNTGRATDDQLRVLQKEQATTHRPLQELAVRHQYITPKELTQLYAKTVDIPFIEIDPRDIPTDALKLLPERVARQYNAIVFKIENGIKFLAMEDPDDIQAVSFLEKQLGSDIRLHIATHENILRAIESYRSDVGKELSEVIQVERAEGAEGAEQVSEEDIAEDSPIAQTVNLLLEYAIRSNASDIHIEPREDFVQIRYRIDGVLQEVNRLPQKVLNALVSRIKILSNLKIDERRVPQDGRFKIAVGGRPYALRVSTLPVSDGEKVALRILDESDTAQTLEQLGYWGRSLDVVNHAITQPHGMVLVTGPTGSGKSTSLFSILTTLNKPSVNISTVEDPIEYRIPGVNQTQVNPKAGMTFANGLRALLRQDPNIIMVGEIRDSETANLAVQAALTGHLVFSTLHTNNASTSLPRLLDMNIEPFLIASTVRAVIGQRLVRRLCTVCRVSYAPSPEEQVEIIHTFGLSAGIGALHTLEAQVASQGVGTNIGEDLSTSEENIVRIWAPSSQGCNNCNHTGYKGRIGIYETLENSASIQKFIVSNATSDTIQAQAIKEGMVTMQTDGLIKVLRGETSVEEILRATRE